MIFSIIVRKKYLYGAFKIIFSPETFSTSLGHTGDNLERRFRRHLGGRGLITVFFRYLINMFYSSHCLSFPFLEGCRLKRGHTVLILFSHSLKKKKKKKKKLLQNDSTYSC